MVNALELLLQCYTIVFCRVIQSNSFSRHSVKLQVRNSSEIEAEIPIEKKIFMQEIKKISSFPRNQFLHSNLRR